MTRIFINKNVLNWALKRSGMTISDFERKFPKIAQWETGESAPTLRQLEKFARATLTPLGYLFLSEPPEDKLPIPHFRTISDEALNRPSPELLDTVRYMQQRQAWMHEFLIEQGQEVLAFVHTAKLDDDPVRVALEMRQILGLDDSWAKTHNTWTNALKALINAAENVGILVVVNSILRNNTHRKLDCEEFRGFVLVDDYSPLVFINGADGKAAQMFTLAHELSHVWFGSSAAFDLRQMEAAKEPTEQMCNQVAAEFLVPTVELAKFWPAASQSDNPFQAIARHFKVSILVAARRALDLDLISRESFFDFYRRYQEDESRAAKKIEMADFYATQSLKISRKFAKAVLQATSEGSLLYKEAYQLTGLYGQTFERFAESLGPGLKH